MSDITYEVTFEPFGDWVSTSEDGQASSLPVARYHAGDGELALLRVKDWAIDVAESAQAQGMDTFIVRIEREQGDGTVWNLVVAPGMAQFVTIPAFVHEGMSFEEGK